MSGTCPKCGHERVPEDLGPDYECPQCRIVYHKYSHGKSLGTLPRLISSSRERPPQPTRPSPHGRAVVFSGVLLLLLILGSMIWNVMGSAFAGRSEASAPGQPVVVVESSFDRDVLEMEDPVLVDFWAPWCGPCRLMGKTLEQVGPEYAGRLHIVQLNIDDFPSLARRYNVRAIPTLVLFDRGSEITRIRGAMPPAQLRQRLDVVLN